MNMVGIVVTVFKMIVGLFLAWLTISVLVIAAYFVSISWLGVV